MAPCPLSPASLVHVILCSLGRVCVAFVARQSRIIWLSLVLNELNEIDYNYKGLKDYLIKVCAPRIITIIIIIIINIIIIIIIFTKVLHLCLASEVLKGGM